MEVLGVPARLGLYKRSGAFHIVGMDDYLHGRGHVDVILQSLPQSIFQSANYILGDLRATGIYIDDTSFVSSVVLLLSSLTVHVCMLPWEALGSGKCFLSLSCAAPGRSGQRSCMPGRVTTGRRGSPGDLYADEGKAVLTCLLSVCLFQSRV